MTKQPLKFDPIKFKKNKGQFAKNKIGRVGVEAKKRCFVSASGPAHSPSKSRLVEIILLHLLNKFPHSSLSDGTRYISQLDKVLRRKQATPTPDPSSITIHLPEGTSVEEALRSLMTSSDELTVTEEETVQAGSVELDAKCRTTEWRHKNRIKEGKVIKPRKAYIKRKEIHLYQFGLRTTITPAKEKPSVPQYPSNQPKTFEQRVDTSGPTKRRKQLSMSAKKRLATPGQAQ